MYETMMLVLLSLVALGGALPQGMNRLKFGSRIIGGNETTIEENPWQVSLELLGIHNCGGCIISENAIVTAAQCIPDSLLLLLYNVRAGTTDLSSDDGITVAIESAIMHKQYSGVDYDIAIIKLAENLTFSDKIQPIGLPENELDVGSEVIVSGWGSTWEGGFFSESILRSVVVEITDKDECNNVYSEYFPVTDRMVCAGVPEGGKDACQGDAGGPLSANGTLYGLTSWGMGCGERGYPGVYTNVVNLVTWVKENAGIA